MSYGRTTRLGATVLTASSARRDVPTGAGCSVVVEPAEPRLVHGATEARGTRGVRRPAMTSAGPGEGIRRW